MQYYNLGKSQLKVSSLCLGTMMFGDQTELAEARIVHTETNLRPALPDNLPRVEQSQGLVRINGLFRHGWLIAPALVEQTLQGIT